MFLLGPVVNTIAILLGTLIGARLQGMPERVKTTVLQGLGLFVIPLGLSMVLAAPGGDVIYIMVSVVLGGVLGAWWNIESLLERFGVWCQSKFPSGKNRIGEAFVFASLVYGVGSMAILGALQSGLSGQNTILYTKSLLDGFSGIIFTTVMGSGVALSAIPILIYEGGIATIAHFFGASLHSAPITTDVTAVGGLLIVGIGVNILEIKRIKVANLLPGMLVVAVVRWLSMHGLAMLSGFIHL
ncbi:MAG: DUF554 domain-containing protein [Bacilli bacterium]